MTTHTFASSEVSDTMTAEELVNKARAHYLGGLYYNADLHPNCHTSDVGASLPQEAPARDVLDIAAQIRERAVTNAAADFEAAIKKQNPGFVLKASVGTAFQEALEKEVNKAVAADVIWFVTRVTGGIDTLADIPQMAKCFQKYREAHEQGLVPGLVTGLAGFIIRRADLNVSLSSRTAIDAAVNAAAAIDPNLPVSPDFRSSLSASWKKHVDRVVELKVSKKLDGVTVYPIWVQFEGVRTGFDFAAVEARGKAAPAP
jgi:hypothetical protein